VTPGAAVPARTADAVRSAATDTAHPPRPGSAGAPGDAGEPGCRILAGAPIAESIRSEARATLAAVPAAGQRLPGVAIVLVGDDQPSRVYARRILRNAAAIGVPGRLVELDGTIDAASLRRELDALSRDPSVGGVIVQMPLPAHIRPRAIVEALDPLKDIDGIHPLNAGLAALGHEAFVPSCAEAALEVLRRTGQDLAGRRAVVVGRSNVVGRPAAQLLLREHCTVTICHRRTRDLRSELARADIVVAAAGAPGLVRGEMLRPGAVVVDCGINVVEGVVVGDVDLQSVIEVASAVSPVPGGVGPVTNAVLMHHLARAVRAQARGGFDDAVASKPVTG
jgi:methylenetetrahydrofolate dehydrogenase (NADP+) / methenyltetrahydrofolate cyclohydrolase